MVVFVECVWRQGSSLGTPTLYLLVCFFVAVFCLFVFKDRVSRA